MKKIILQNPENLGHRYNFFRIIHKISELVTGNLKDFDMEKTKSAIKNLKFINRNLEYISVSEKCIKSRID